MFLRVLVKNHIAWIYLKERLHNGEPEIREIVPAYQASKPWVIMHTSDEWMQEGSCLSCTYTTLKV